MSADDDKNRKDNSGNTAQQDNSRQQDTKKRQDNDSNKRQDGDSNKRQDDNDTKGRNGNNSAPTAFLGLMVEELHPAFATHLPGSAVRGQGLMVEDVGNDSPAGKAGIKAHDILMTYDDQKLFTPEQFVKLIHGDKPGREVSLGVIREGKSQTVKAQLGQRDAKWDHPNAQGHSPHHPNFGPGWPGHGQGNQQSSHSTGDHPAWSSFDSLILKKLDKDRYNASVSYTDKEGKVQKHEYEGTREEIRKKIEQDKDLLPNERYHLTRGLDLQDGNFPFFLLPDHQPFDF